MRVEGAGAQIGHSQLPGKTKNLKNRRSTTSAIWSIEQAVRTLWKCHAAKSDVKGKSSSLPNIPKGFGHCLGLSRLPCPGVIFGMPSPLWYTVDHSVRFTSNRDAVDLAASVFLPVEDDLKTNTLRVGNNVTPKGAAVPGPTDRQAIVMVHAHPKFGGAPEMMHGIAADMAAHGLCVVNLALRGAGESKGEPSWRGDCGEVSDVVTACDYAKDTLKCDKVHLMGYSFGATVCGGAIDKRDFIATYVAVAYPLGHWFSRGVLGIGAKLIMHAHTPSIKDSTKPKMFIIGTADDFTSKGATERFANRCAQPYIVKPYEGCDHFGFVSGKECEQLCKDARQFFQSTKKYVDASNSKKMNKIKGGAEGEWFEVEPTTPLKVNTETETDHWSEVFEDAASPGRKR